MSDSVESVRRWAKLPLGELCSIDTGDKDVNEGNPLGAYPFFTCGQEVFAFDSYSFEGDAILVAGNGNFNVKKHSGRFEAYQRTYVLQSFNIEHLYLYYYLLHKLPEITKDNRGTTVRYIRIQNLSDYTVVFPSLLEQRRIVAKIEELFSELDKGVESLKAARAQLKTYRQSLLKAAFEGRLTEQWRRDNADKLETADQLLQRIREERQVRYQQQLEEWRVAVAEWEAVGKYGKKPQKPKLALQERDDYDVFNATIHEDEGWLECRLGAIIDPPKYGTSKKCGYDFGDVPVLRIPNVAKGVVSLDDLKYAEFSKDEIATWRLKSGDFLLVRSNGSISLLGTGATVRKDHEQCLYAGYLMRIRVNPLIMMPDFLRLAFQSPGIREQVERKGKSTSGVHNINSKEACQLVFPVFSLLEQAKIVSDLESKLSRADELEVEIVQALKNAEALRQSILKRAFEGKLVPQDPDDEPASVLLECIRQEQADAPKPKRRKRQIGVIA